jgi:transposase InsO family protein
VFVQIKSSKTAANARTFLKALHQACPIKISKILTDNGTEFTDRLFASREREPSGKHVFDQTCQELSIEHCLTQPRTPRTNGTVERFNGRIADVSEDTPIQQPGGFGADAAPVCASIQPPVAAIGAALENAGSGHERRVRSKAWVVQQEAGCFDRGKVSI